MSHLKPRAKRRVSRTYTRRQGDAAVRGTFGLEQGEVVKLPSGEMQIHRVKDTGQGSLAGEGRYLYKVSSDGGAYSFYVKANSLKFAIHLAKKQLRTTLKRPQMLKVRSRSPQNPYDDPKYMRAAARRGRAVLRQDERSQSLAKPENTDEHAVTELVQYIENDSSLMGDRSQGASIRLNLRKKLAKGTFDFRRSVKLWEYLAESGAKKYCKEFCSQTDKWFTMFPPEVRRAVAAKLAEDWYTEEKLQSGAGDDMGDPSERARQSVRQRHG